MSGAVKPISQIASVMVAAGVGRLTWCQTGGTIHIQVPASDVMIGQRDQHGDYLFVPPREVPGRWTPVEVLDPRSHRRLGEDERDPVKDALEGRWPPKETSEVKFERVPDAFGNYPIDVADVEPRPAGDE